MKNPIIDLHEDLSLYYILHGAGQSIGDFDVDLAGRDGDIPKYIRGNIRIIFAAILPGVSTFDPKMNEINQELYGMRLTGTSFTSMQSLLLDHLKIYYRLSERYNIRFILNSEDAEKIISSEKWIMGFIIHLEGADPITEVYELKLLYRLGLRGIGLTWNFNNRYSASCTSKKDYGLTDDGYELIKFANKLGVIIDLAHASKNSILDAIEASSKPVIISHTNLRRNVDTPRNIDEDILDMILENNGLIGLSVISTLITRDKRPSIDDLANQYIEIIDKYSADILAIGSDFHGLLSIPPPKGLETVDKLQNLLEKLGENGLDKIEIEKIAYKNALRVIRENIK